MIKNIVNLGDAAIYCDFGNEVDKETNLKVIKYFKNIKDKKLKGVTNLSPSYNKLIITFDLNETSFDKLSLELSNLDIENEIENKCQKINIPLCFDDEYSLDIFRLEKKLSKSKNEIIKTFLSKTYFCYMTGFIAGMPFLGDLENELHAKRLETPRVKVPKGSVGLTEQFANIYTFESPGGWNILGNTPLDVFDNSKETDPNLINPGDIVVFKQINLEDYNSYNDK